MPTFGSQRTQLMLLGTLCLGHLGIVVWWHFAVGRPLVFGAHPLLELRHSVGALAATIIALTWAKFRFKGFNVLLGPFALLAPISYGIYVLHRPLCITASFFGFIPNKSLELADVVIRILLAILFEVKLQRWINRVIRFRSDRRPAVKYAAPAMID